MCSAQADLGRDQLLLCSWGGGGGALLGALAAQRSERTVGSLLAAHEHGAEGGAHTGAAIQLSHLNTTRGLAGGKMEKVGAA